MYASEIYLVSQHEIGHVGAKGSNRCGKVKLVRKCQVGAKGSNQKGEPGSAWPSLSQFSQRPTSIQQETSLVPGLAQGVRAKEGAVTLDYIQENLRLPI